jgi:hypothetical protein
MPDWRSSHLAGKVPYELRWLSIVVRSGDHATNAKVGVFEQGQVLLANSHVETARSEHSRGRESRKPVDLSIPRRRGHEQRQVWTVGLTRVALRG